MIVGFIGLGTMGGPMARNLEQAGYNLVVYNRSRQKAEALGLKAEIVSSAAEAARRADVLFTMLSDDNSVREVYFGENGILSAYAGREGGTGAAKGKLVVDCSTISPATTLQVAEALAAHGVDMLDAPVTGSRPQAEEGVLTFIVGGKRELYEQCLPLFQAMGKKAVYMGANGNGSKTKLANNALVATNLVAVAESVSLVAKAGIDPELFLEVVAGGGARSGMAEMKGPKMLAGDFSPQFMAQLMHKDLKLAARLAEELQVPTPALAAVKALFQIACNEGYGGEDMSAVYKCYRDWAGLE